MSISSRAKDGTHLDDVELSLQLQPASSSRSGASTACAATRPSSQIYESHRDFLSVNRVNLDDLEPTRPGEDPGGNPERPPRADRPQYRRRRAQREPAGEIRYSWRGMFFIWIQFLRDIVRLSVQPQHAGAALLQHRVPLVEVRLLRGEQLVGGIENFDALDLVALRDRVHHVLALGHFAEDRVLAIEPRTGHVRDEKLAAVRAGAGVGHRENAGLRVLERLVDLVGEIVAGAAAAGARRVAALDHEVRDHAVKLDAVVIPALGEVQEIGGGHRHLRGEDGAFDIAAGGVEEDANVLHKEPRRCGRQWLLANDFRLVCASRSRHK